MALRQRIASGFMALLLITGGVMITGENVYAYTGKAWCANGGTYGSGKSINGTKTCKGYFNGRLTDGRIDAGIGNLLSGGMYVNSIGSFVSKIKGYIKDGGRNKDGAAMIISEMMSWRGKSLGSVTSSSNIAKWEKLVRAYDSRNLIKWNVNRGVKYNSAWVSKINDPVYHKEMVDFKQRSIEFISPGGATFRIIRECGNLIGSAALKDLDDWTLTPKLTNSGVSANGTVSQDTVVQPTKAYVTKTGDSTDNTQWVFGRAIIPPGGSNLPGKKTNKTSPGAYYGGGTWTELRKGTRKFTSSSTTLTSNAINIESLEVGTKVCWTLSINPPRPAYIYDGWSHATPFCFTIVPQPIRPQVQVLGYDARLNGKVVTNISRELGTSIYYGSWSEYGVLSSNQNQNFASAAGLKNGAVGTQTDWSNLTFSNSQSTGSTCRNAGYQFGCAAHPQGGVSYPQSFVDKMRNRCSQLETADIVIGSLSGFNETKYFCTTGTARISGDITYADGNTGNARSLPQVVIIANDIIVDPGVNRIDAWLIAGGEANAEGRISTCSAMRTPAAQFPKYADITNNVFYAHKDECRNPLTVTGPVVSKKMYLFRTTSSQDGASKPVDTPAETFNLRADAFLWAYNGGTSSLTKPVAQTISIKELPPRF